MPAIPNKLAVLTRLLELAGARNPEGWAKSELQEDIPQLARFMFLRQAWRGVISDDDTMWIDNEITESKLRKRIAGSSLGPALARCLETGCSKQDLTTVARTAQWRLLHHICRLLSDPSIEEPQLRHIDWALVEVDEKGARGREIAGLHESVLETDPTGREMASESSVKV